MPIPSSSIRWVRPGPLNRTHAFSGTEPLRVEVLGLDPGTIDRYRCAGLEGFAYTQIVHEDDLFEEKPS